MQIGARSSLNFVKSMAGRYGGGASHFTTSTAPQMHAPKLSPVNKARLMKGEIVAVGMAVGMIALSTSFGLYTALKELRTGPNVYVKKARRETIPEVIEPERVLEQSEKFVNKSFFREVAHIQDKFRHHAFSRPPKAETLKDVGVDPV